MASTRRTGESSQGPGLKEGARAHDPPAPGVPVRGVAVDGEGRCAHYGGPRDVVAVRFRCCGRVYACHACHAVLEDHPADPWPEAELDRKAVLCGACGGWLTCREYLASASACPRCAARFNAGCERHHHLYFEVPERPRPS